MLLVTMRESMSITHQVLLWNYNICLRRLVTLFSTGPLQQRMKRWWKQQSDSCNCAQKNGQNLTRTFLMLLWANQRSTRDLEEKSVDAVSTDVCRTCKSDTCSNNYQTLYSLKNDTWVFHEKRPDSASWGLSCWPLVIWVKAGQAFQQGGNNGQKREKSWFC